ncbi:ArgK protein [Terrimonas sp.]|uniref:cobalamin-dependent protein n=1 Tax=Terrimonas sp. TaxID=1914338 RepID=UPI000D5247E9|nr:cobalamin-dependent protein [Terrimonas sp.]PVD52629.1 ArgK protein [Terrimonas sp.]
MSQKIRIVTATSLFDGHDAAINIMRRILQSKGVEVIHLGHNRSAHEIVECAIEEDATAVAITSYQGGHIEFFKYIKELLDKNGASHIKIFGGGGGTILPKEIEELHKYGITRIYSPDDGRKMGLEGMIEDVIMLCANGHTHNGKIKEPAKGKYPLGEAHNIKHLAQAITSAEGKSNTTDDIPLNTAGNKSVVIGITGTGGAGKSSVTDEIVRRYLAAFSDKTIAVISVDPSKKKTGGALLGDRIRMNAISHPRAYMRSLATREDNTALSSVAQQAIALCKNEGYDCIILESAGVGQSDVSIVDHCDVSIYVMTPEYGAASQLEKINMLDYADIIVINKFDKPGAEDALMDVRKQYKRNHQLFTAKDEDLPVLGVCANKFNDEGINHLFDLLSNKINDKLQIACPSKIAGSVKKEAIKKSSIIPDSRIRYLSEISETIRNYNNWVNEQSTIATQLYQLNGSITILNKTPEK